jgi:phosphatidylserine/phosphatidylglycerophosphate/cardiolipin synthase-like enzyme
MELKALQGLERGVLEKARTVLKATPSPASVKVKLGAAGGPFVELLQAGWSGAHLVQAIDWVLAERSAGEERIQVVTTLPEGEGTQQFAETAVELRQLFSQARKSVLVAGYRLNRAELLAHLVRHAADQLEVELYLDVSRGFDPAGHRRKKKDLGEDYPERWWAEWRAAYWPPSLPPPRAYYAPALLDPGEEGVTRIMHVKTAVVDGHIWFVSSANFTHSGHFLHYELGARIDDVRLAGQVTQHFRALVGQGAFVPFEG